MFYSIRVWIWIDWTQAKTTLIGERVFHFRLWIFVFVSRVGWDYRIFCEWPADGCMAQPAPVVFCFSRDAFDWTNTQCLFSHVHRAACRIFDYWAGVLFH